MIFTVLMLPNWNQPPRKKGQAITIQKVCQVKQTFDFWKNYTSPAEKYKQKPCIYISCQITVYLISFSEFNYFVSEVKK